MSYEGYTTIQANSDSGVLTVTFDFPPVNVQGQEMLADLNGLAMRLERDREIKVVVFQSAHPAKVRVMACWILATSHIATQGRIVIKMLIGKAKIL